MVKDIVMATVAATETNISASASPKEIFLFIGSSTFPFITAATAQD